MTRLSGWLRHLLLVSWFPKRGEVTRVHGKSSINRWIAARIKGLPGPLNYVPLNYVRELMREVEDSCVGSHKKGPFYRTLFSKMGTEFRV